MPSPSLKAVAFRVAQLCASHLPPPEVHQGPAACKPPPFPVLRAYMSHTGHPDAAHLRQLVSVTSWLGLDPFIQWWAVGRVYWLHSPRPVLLAAAGSSPCLLAGVISQAAQKKKQKTNQPKNPQLPSAHQIVPAALLPRLKSQQRRDLHGVSPAVLLLFLFKQKI